MVKVQVNKEHCMYYHMILNGVLTNMKKEVLKKDYDGFFVVDGPEGYGKSTLAMQLAMFCDPTFNLDRVVFTLDQFVDAVEHATKGQAIVFDETMGYLGARGAMTKFNRTLIKVFSEMRSKNLFIFLCIPSFFELDKYPAIHRSIMLLHVYKRGAFTAFNYNKKKNLYIKGKKFYSYKEPGADFIGDFRKYFPLDKEAYEKKKQVSIMEFNKTNDRESKIQHQRDMLIHYVYKNNEITQESIANMLNMSRVSVTEAVGRVEAG